MHSTILSSHRNQSFTTTLKRKHNHSYSHNTIDYHCYGLTFNSAFRRYMCTSSSYTAIMTKRRHKIQIYTQFIRIGRGWCSVIFPYLRMYIIDTEFFFQHFFFLCFALCCWFSSWNWKNKNFHLLIVLMLLFVKKLFFSFSFIQTKIILIRGYF